MRGMYQGPITVDQDGDWRGMVDGDLVIGAGRHVRVRGMVNGDVIVGPGAEAIITGMVNGEVIETGGRARVTGMVKG